LRGWTHRRGSTPLHWAIHDEAKVRLLLSHGASVNARQVEGRTPLYQAASLGNGFAANAWPQNSDQLLSGGSPRYHLYETRDGKIAAVAALEQKFWLTFTRAIGLETDYIDDMRDPEATAARVAEIIAARNATEWAPIFDRADCCCSIVQDAQAAVQDPQFAARGLFARKLVNANGDTIPALPVPIANDFREQEDTPSSAPAPGANNAEFGFPPR